MTITLKNVCAHQSDQGAQFLSRCVQLSFLELVRWKSEKKGTQNPFMRLKVVEIYKNAYI